MLRTILVVTLTSLFMQSVAFAQSETEKQLEERVRNLEQEVDRLQKQLAALHAKIEAMEAKSPSKEVANPEMDLIYQSMKITNAKVVGGPFSPGDQVKVVYDLTNTSEVALQVPLNKSFSRPFNLVGAMQHWIERQGDQDTIPAIPERIGRKGSRYAAGGSIIPTKNTISAGEVLPFEQRLTTTGYPVGKYIYFIEYKKLGEGIIQSEKVEFELKDK